MSNENGVPGIGPVTAFVERMDGIEDLEDLEGWAGGDLRAGFLYVGVGQMGEVVLEFSEGVAIGMTPAMAVVVAESLRRGARVAAEATSEAMDAKPKSQSTAGGIH